LEGQKVIPIKNEYMPNGHQIKPAKSGQWRRPRNPHQLQHESIGKKAVWSSPK